MDTLESAAQSFIVKVWVEECSTGDEPGVWHGHITHVSSGKRHYLKNLDEMRDFITPYIEEMGVSLGRRRSIWHRMQHLLIEMKI